MTTLPQPQLAQMGMMWIVTCGTLKFNNAFTHQLDAVIFAKDAALNGACKVWVGHTVFGWFDFFEWRDSQDDCMSALTAWHDGFMQDDWHKSQWKSAVVHGDFSAALKA